MSSSDGIRSGSAQQRALVEALLRDDIEGTVVASEELGDDGFFPVLSATLAAVTQNVWPEGLPLSDIPAVAARIADQVAGDAHVPAVMIETSIRAALGEYDLLEGFKATDLIPAFLLIIKTAARTELVDLGRRDVVTRDALDALDDE